MEPIRNYGRKTPASAGRWVPVGACVGVVIGVSLGFITGEVLAVVSLGACCAVAGALAGWATRWLAALVPSPWLHIAISTAVGLATGILFGVTCVRPVPWLGSALAGAFGGLICGFVCWRVGEPDDD